MNYLLLDYKFLNRILFFLKTPMLEHDQTPWLCDLALSSVLCCVTFGKDLTTQFSLVVMPPPSHGYGDEMKMYIRCFAIEFWRTVLNQAGD